jgi:hypothetical protein
MEITEANKAKIKQRLVAQYYGQNVIKETRFEKSPLCQVCGTFIDNPAELSRWHLELFSLSDITDEHAIEVAKLLFTNPTAEKGRKYLSDDNDVQMMFISDVVDLVRSLGYAVRWNNLSVEDQIKEGFTKLKTMTISEKREQNV